MLEIREARDAQGKLIAWLQPLLERNWLRQCSDRVVADFAAQPTERFDAMDQIYWDFLLAGEHLVLHWDKAQGVGIVAGNTAPRTEELVRRVSQHLARVIQPDSAG